jgi:ribonucleotide reductase alpha subunit
VNIDENIFGKKPTTTTHFDDVFSAEIWQNTYKDYNDNNIDDTVWRVACAVASVETIDEKKKEWAQKFYDLISNFNGVPGGRILSNAGTDWHGGTTLANCFVSPLPKQDIDSLNGILTVLEHQAKTLKSEGGWGHNFSAIRPRGAFIYGIGVETPGAVKYMELFDKSSDIITSGSGQKTKNARAKGKIRKGAMMGVLDIWHPDIIEFITAKQTPGRLSKFNMSVNCTDEFMSLVSEIHRLKSLPGDNQVTIDAITWNLEFPDTTHKHYRKELFGNLKEWKSKNYPTIIYKTVKVDWLWNLITDSTYNRNEPGVLFLDRANHFNPLNYRETIAATNPCVTGDTLVAVADGRGELTIKQLMEEGKDVPVYTVDSKNKLAIRILRNPRISGYNQPVFKVFLDDGSFVRVTRNHKFLLSDGSYKEAINLMPGDSLALLTKYKSSFKEIFKESSTTNNISDYWWLNYNRGNVGEHRLIAGFHNNTEVVSGQVVHHIDYNSLNNSPDNLQIMSKVEHDKFHLSRMLGDNNPMRRAQFEWSEEKWKNYRNKHSVNNTGEKNSNWSGYTNDDLKVHALSLTRSLGYRFSIKQWAEYAREHDLPEQFSKWRNNHLNGIQGLAKWAAREIGIDQIDLDPRTARRYKHLQNQGYDFDVQVDGSVIFNKICEVCDSSFRVKNRTIAYCSLTCNLKKNPDINERRSTAHRDNISARHEKLRVQQVEVFNDLKFKLGKNPQLKEWRNECKNRKISSEVNRKSSPFIHWTELIETASNYNHRVKSVEYCGMEDVYNGTVDEYHNFFIGGFKSSTVSGKEKIHYINNLNCGEQMLSPSGVCDLGTLNLTQFINNSRTGFNLKKIEKYVSYMVRFLDNVNEYSDAPLPEYVYSMRNKRRIGCGVMGWGSALYMLKIRYGSDEANKLRDDVMKAFTHAGVKTSIELAKEKGMFSECEPEKHALSPFWDSINLPNELREEIRRHGIRNSSLFSIQPNGNSSILANIITGGLEPVFLPEYIRTVIVANTPEDIINVTPNWSYGEFHETEMFKFADEGDEQILRGVAPDGTVYKIDKNRGLTKEVLCQDYGVRYLSGINEWDPKADYAVTATSLTVADHLNDLKGFSRWLDSACSKTTNISNDYPFTEFQNIYLDAYKTGFIKGVTTYRSGTMTSVLSAKQQKEEPSSEEVILENIKLSDSNNAVVKVLRAEQKKWYVTIVMNENSAPVAIFVQTNSLEKTVIASDATERLLGLGRSKGIPEKYITSTEQKCLHDSNSTKIARAISLLLRHGVLVKNIVSQLDQVENVPFGSFLFQIKKFLASYIKDGETVENAKCSNCNSSNIVYAEGCQKCMQCGSGKCS